MSIELIKNATVINATDITTLANVTTLNGFLYNVNSIIFQGWLFFILMMLFWIILLVAMESAKSDIISNINYSGGVVSILCIILMSLGLMAGTLAFIPAVITMIGVFIQWSSKTE